MSDSEKSLMRLYDEYLSQYCRLKLEYRDDPDNPLLKDKLESVTKVLRTILGTS